MSQTGSPMSPLQAYAKPAILLHWLTAICVITAIPLAIGMSNLPEGPLQDTLFNYHKSFGQLVWFVAVLRVANRWMAGAPGPLDTLTSFERMASHLVHSLMYILIIVVPIFGYIGTGAYPAPLTFFFFEMPNILPSVLRGEKVSEFFLTGHKWLAITLGTLVVVHIGAAMFHAMVKRDGVLARMTTWRG